MPDQWKDPRGPPDVKVPEIALGFCPDTVARPVPAAGLEIKRRGLTKRKLSQGELLAVQALTGIEDESVLEKLDEKRQQILLSALENQFRIVRNIPSIHIASRVWQVRRSVSELTTGGTASVAVRAVEWLRMYRSLLASEVDGPHCCPGSLRRLLARGDHHLALRAPGTQAVRAAALTPKHGSTGEL